MLTLSSAERQFIHDHLTDDVRSLILRAHPADLDLKKLATQIASRQKARDKLPTWYAQDAVVFPPALSVEQASSERTATYKASLVSGRLLFDLTGGMGVDTWAFARRVERVIYVEQQPVLAELAAFNLPLLNTPNVEVRTGNGLAVITNSDETADWLYLDPHRRNSQGGKVVRLQDCEPDIADSDTLARLLAKADHILVKTSPLIDIEAVNRQLPCVEAVHVVAVQGEVKEVLFVLNSSLTFKETIKVNAVNLVTDKTVSFSFTTTDERAAHVTLGDPQRFIYEPNAAVLKAGAFRLLTSRFHLMKLAPNSHLYTSNEIQPDFPGRIFDVEHVIKPDRKALQSVVPSLKANLTVRNFPQSVAELRKKLALQEGGTTYIFATTLQNGDKRLIVAQKADLG